ncbi:fatty acid elongation protein, GNS1/SUR4 family, putative [Plasmodium ovale]|uniref:Elongation of fatty acids protein n=1 Tax=Plasmodium ovale TaxID=36330 RepID=A0A1D3KX24_PLAOA|nr:fatty acid elongation protein, GNS1/SUR4 family, putative [Plasmodium ovale]
MVLTNFVIRTNSSGHFKVLGPMRDYPREPIFRIEDIFPSLGLLTFEWERKYTPFGFIEFVHRYYWLCPLVVAAYILLCRYGHIIMKKKSAFNLRWIIIIWNLALSFLNFIVVVRLLPVFVYIVYNYTLDGFLIIPPIYMYAFGSAGLWACLFVISKFLELIDTLFLILKKKKKTLLHWFHHSTVLLYTWDTYYAELPAGFIFILINAFVHTVMYFYYFLATIYQKPLRWNIIVTLIQILQMVIGIVLTIYCFSITCLYKFRNTWDIYTIRRLKQNFSFDNGHYISRTNVFLAALMYMSYLYLFARYFYNRYLRKQPKAHIE